MWLSLEPYVGWNCADTCLTSRLIKFWRIGDSLILFFFLRFFNASLKINFPRSLVPSNKIIVRKYRVLNSLKTTRTYSTHFIKILTATVAKITPNMIKIHSNVWPPESNCSIRSGTVPCGTFWSLRINDVTVLERESEQDGCCVGFWQLFLQSRSNTQAYNMGGAFYVSIFHEWEGFLFFVGVVVCCDNTALLQLLFLNSTKMVTHLKQFSKHFKIISNITNYHTSEKFHVWCDIFHLLNFYYPIPGWVLMSPHVIIIWCRILFFHPRSCDNRNSKKR